MKLSVKNSAWLLLAINGAACSEIGDRKEGSSDLGETSEAISNVCPGASVEGIDIASFQHPNGAGINWGQVATAEKFVIVKATENTTYSNSYYADDVAGARAAGLIVGSYHFLSPSSQSGKSGVAQAQYFLAHASIQQGDLPPMLDVETEGIYNNVLPSVADIQGWLTTVQAATGRKPMVYIGYYVMSDLGNPAELKDYWIDVPNYSNCPSYPDSYPISNLVMWQHTSTAGVPGISGNVDSNKFYGTLEQLQAFAQADQAATGYLDHAGCDSIAGWGWDPDKKDTSTNVDVYFNGPAGAPGAAGVRNPADQSRADLCTALGSCNHGFTEATPRSLFDGANHDVHAYAIDLNGSANGELNGSPKTVQCAQLDLPANTVKRWVTDPDTFTAWQFNSFTDVAPAADAQLTSEANGADIDAPPSCVQADDGTPEVWVIDQGLRRHVINPDSLTAWRFTVTQAPAATVYANPVGPDWPTTPALVKGSGPAVYLLDTPLPSASSSAGTGGSTGSSNGSGLPSGSGTGTGETSGEGGSGGDGGGSASAGSKTGACSYSPAGSRESAGWLFALAAGAVVFARRRRVA